MIHRPGRENIADPLSRLLHRKVEPDNHQRCTEEYIRFVAVSATPTALTTREIEEACDKHGRDRIGKTWTGLIKHGLIKHGLIKHGVIKHRVIKHGLKNMD